MAAVVIARWRGWRSLVSISNQVREMPELVQRNVNGRAFSLDTLSYVKRLEEQGVPSKQAEAITSVFTEVLNDKPENMSQSFVSNEKMRMCEIVQDSNISKVKYEVQSSKDCHFSSLLHEIDKLSLETEKMRDELRHEMQVGFKEIHALMHDLKYQLSAVHLDTIKYVVGTLLSISAAGAAGAAVFRIWMSGH